MIAALTGAMSDDGGLDVYWDPRVEEKWQGLLDRNAGFRLIGINPGGDRPNRRWPADRFAIVAEALLHDGGTRIVLFGGPGEEGLARMIKDRLPSSSVTSLAGALSLHDLCYLISKLDLFITNDSGPMHIAAAAKTPVVALFGPEHPRNLRPYAPDTLYRVVYKEVPCRPCNRSSCGNPICLTAIAPADVVPPCRELLNATFSRKGTGEASHEDSMGGMGHLPEDP
jgi:heptosyltransferase-2